MNDFEYANPKTIEDAVGLLGTTWGETEILAGGTDLITSLKQGLTEPRRIVSLKQVAGIDGLSQKGDTLRIGAMTRLKDVVGHAGVRSNFPAMVTAIENISSQQMINMGTLGGDLLQRPRCWYYRMGLGLLGMQDGKSLVETGDNRYHAVFGNRGDAKFVHASSLAPVLIALGATLEIQGAGNKRSVAAQDFFATPKTETDRESVLKPNDVVTAIEIPVKGLKNGLYEVRQRQGLDWPMVAAAVAYRDNAGKAADARIVLGHVAPTPWYSDKGSEALNGQRVTAETLDKASAVVVAEATPLSGNNYKVAQVKAAIRRAGLSAAG